METVSTPKMEQMDTKSQKKRRANSPLVPLFESLDKNLADPNSTLRQMVEVLDSKFIDLEILVEVQTGTIDKLTEENSQLQRRCNVNEGRITRLEKVVEDLREEALNSTAHSMKDNLIFQNIAEHPEEVNVKQTLVDFMAKELLIQATDLQSISINKGHRMGAKGKHGRASIANINDNGKSII
jgi:predicted nuclease with TOPRIM domain